MSELQRQQWREGIYQAFSSEGCSKEQAADYTSRFDKLTDTGKMTGETAASVIYGAFGSKDAKKVCQSIKQLIEQELSEYAGSHPGISKDPLVRLRAWVKRFNDSVGKCSVEIDGQPALDEKQLAQVRVRLPGCLNPPTAYSAMASKGKTANLEIEVSV